MAEGLVEAGGHVHCLDRAPSPPKAFAEARTRIKGQSGGTIEYHQVDVTQDETVEKCVAEIAAERQRLDGLIAGPYPACGLL
jgi:D-arabinitol 2-dehydrogenase